MVLAKKCFSREQRSRLDGSPKMGKWVEICEARCRRGPRDPQGVQGKIQHKGLRTRGKDKKKAILKTRP